MKDKHTLPLRPISKPIFSTTGKVQAPSVVSYGNRDLSKSKRSRRHLSQKISSTYFQTHHLRCRDISQKISRRYISKAIQLRCVRRPGFGVKSSPKFVPGGVLTYHPGVIRCLAPATRKAAWVAEAGGIYRMHPNYTTRR